MLELLRAALRWLLGDPFALRASQLELRMWADQDAAAREIDQLHRQRERDREDRIRIYTIGWCHARALRDDRFRTIRLEIERQEAERRRKDQLARENHLLYFKVGAVGGGHQ
jgi:hypothetical protein